LAITRNNNGETYYEFCNHPYEYQKGHYEKTNGLPFYLNKDNIDEQYYL